MHVCASVRMSIVSTKPLAAIKCHPFRGSSTRVYIVIYTYDNVNNITVICLYMCTVTIVIYNYIYIIVCTDMYVYCIYIILNYTYLSTWCVLVVFKSSNPTPTPSRSTVPIRHDNILCSQNNRYTYNTIRVDDHQLTATTSSGCRDSIASHRTVRSARESFIIGVK